ncbi:MAG: hypothetical protein FJ109_10990 [Deltaproteobacteria bacterium]|nr:hypothetical protein [Deltaproteobacteria bacterium]
MKKLLAVLMALALAGFFAASCGGDEAEEEEKDCVKICEGKECGDLDGCPCGTCGADETCEANMCKTPVAPGCEEKCTGKDCGTVEDCDCGTCAEGKTCDAKNMCVDVGDCTAACKDKTCGTVEGCDCGTCADGQVCNDVTLTCECVPVCDGKECGDDGCGAFCGEGDGDQGCEGEDKCIDGLCECTPQCDGKTCGPDKCGGQCGDCGDGTYCQLSTGTCLEEGNCCDTGKFEAMGQKVNFMSVGKGGHPGEALDVDGDPSTCAPVEDCEGGYNNMLSGLLGQLAQFVDADAEIAKALDEGDIALIAEMVDMKTDGTEFTMNMYIGDPAADKATCDFQTAVCEYYVKKDSVDPGSCVPIINFDNATITDGALVAGGPDAIFSVTIPIQEGIALTVTANMAQIVGTIAGEGEAMTLTDGIVGGAVRKDKLMEAVDYIPDDAGLPVSKDMIKNLLDMFVKPDVDTDDDGELDAASIGIKFAAIAGKILGFSPEDCTVE